MTVQHAPTPPNALNQVLESLMTGILSGEYPPHSRLPSERDLSKHYDTSRATLREALGRLSAWGMVHIKRGSGIEVRPKTSWTLDVLPAYLKDTSTRAPHALARVLGDMLHVRRNFYVDFVRSMGARSTQEDVQWERVREQVARAWGSREDAHAFIQEDFEVLRCMAIQVDFMPALWMLNSFGEVYAQIAQLVAPIHNVPQDYVETYERLIDHLAEHDAQAASTVLAEYLDNHDKHLFKLLEFLQ